jgi:tetratricopeptide (TPR) repeat protein
MRIVLTMLSLLVLAMPARAQAIDLVVFGPISDGDAKQVADAMAKAKVGAAAQKPIDLACAAKIECIVTAGADAGARRALAVTASGGKIGFVLVDVVDKELVAKREITLQQIARDYARAQKKFLDDAPTERAKALFAIGNKHYELGEYPQALEIYKKAYRVKPLPAFQFNIAQCHRKLGAHKEAIHLYQAYLVGVPNAENKDLVESLIQESRNQLAAQEKAARDAEQARLDAQKAEAAKKAADAAAKQADADAKAAIAAAEAEKRRQLQVTVDRERELDATYNTHPARTWMVMTGLVGLATAGAGGYFAYRVRDRQAAYDAAACGDPDQNLPGGALGDCQADIDAGKRDARIANILIGAGGGVFLASLIVYIIDPGNIERPERPTVTVTPSSVNMVVRW